ncbi:MAG: NAD(P)-dependent oxidoreductase [Leptospiraceae bacterium]|nr:NAD(P)-dependent oxidoreductase [Leptospiraceae bacterium]
MKILITGGTGFLGRNLVPHLKSHELIFLGRKNTLDQSNIQFIQYDIQEKTIPEVPSQIDLVLHLAAIPSGEANSIEDYFKVNVLGTKNIVNLAKKNSIPRIIFISSTSVYGNWKKEEFLETDELLGKTPYAVSKIQAEQEVINSGLDYCILRVASVFGKDSKSFLYKLVKLSEKGILPYPLNESYKSFIHIDDLVNYLLITIDKKISGIYNLAQTEPVSILKIINLISKNKKIISIPIPSFLNKLETLLRYITGIEIGLKPLFESCIVSTKKSKLYFEYEAEKKILNEFS